MNITLCMVLDILADWKPESLVREDADLSFSSIQLLFPGMGQISTNTLYLGRLSQLKLLKGTDIRQACIVLIGKTEQAYRCAQRSGSNLILLPDGCLLPLVANRLFHSFEYLRNWSNRLETTALSGQGYQSMMELGREVFGENPAIFVNASYNVLGASVMHTDCHPGVDRILTDGYYRKEVTDELSKMGYNARGASYTVPTLIQPPNYMGCPLLVITFHSDKGLFAGFITIYFVKDTPTQSQIKLFDYFGRKIRDCYLQDINREKLMFSPVEQFMHDLIDHTKEDETYLTDRAKVLHLPLDATYRICVISWDDFVLPQAEYIMGRLRNSLKFPYFKVMLYHRSVLMLLQGEISSLRVLEELNESFGELRDLLRVCQGHAGFSTTWSSLLKIDVAYRQALAAIQFGSRLASHEGIYFYSKYFVYDMLDAYSQRFAYEDMYVKKLRLLEKAEEGRFDNLTLLHNYLLTERSISITAKRMHMHRNSVIYRLGKIQETLGVNLSDPDIRLRLLLSFKVMELVSGEMIPTAVAEDEEQMVVHE